MISFELSAEESELQRSTHRYAAEQVRPLARRCEEDGEVAASLVDAFWHLGLAQIGYPEAWGGIEVGISTAVVIEEELAWGDAGVATGMPRIGAAGGVLAALSESPASERMSAMLRDEHRPFVVLVPAAFLPMTHEPHGFSLSGTIVIPAANRAEALVVPCQLKDNMALVWQSLPTPSVRVSVDSHQLGLRAAPLGVVSFDGARISSTDILATGEAACTALRSGLQRELLLLTARSVGTAHAAFDYAARYATQRTAFGRAIADHQAIAFMVADIGIRVEAARALLWNAAWAIDNHDQSRDSAVMAAGAFAADHVVGATSDALQILGGHGYIQDHPLEKWMRDARALTNYSTRVMSGLVGLKTL